MSDKQKFPLALARAVAEKIVAALEPVCSRIVIAGSVRRKKAHVGDVEIVYIPKFTQVKNPLSLFGDEMMRVNAADLIIAELIARGSLAKRLNVNDSETWGEKNKLAVAVKTGIPVDLFSSTEQGWWTYLVCRTGSKETNMRVCNAAIARGCNWRPYEGGFTQKFVSEPGTTRFWRMDSEEEVFRFVGLPFLPPEER